MPCGSSPLVGLCSDEVLLTGEVGVEFGASSKSEYTAEPSAFGSTVELGDLVGELELDADNGALFEADGGADGGALFEADGGALG